MHREATGGEVLVTVGCDSRVPLVKVLPLGGRIVLIRLLESKVKAQLNILSR